MKLIIPDSIRKREQDCISIEILKKVAKKVLCGLSINIASPLEEFSLQKIKITTPKGALRAVFLVKKSSQKAVLVMIRKKNDKQIGQNMATVNKKFEKLLIRYLEMILADLETGNYTEHTI